MPEMLKIAQQLERLAGDLKKTVDTKQRRELLAEMKRLLAQAERITSK